ncbi:hypothetical protein ZTR_10908 [Talaromyces verruculosus]|nr:hypothetical protein ZTR_10908 [Talaromyces verruculosus]
MHIEDQPRHLESLDEVKRVDEKTEADDYVDPKNEAVSKTAANATGYQEYLEGLNMELTPKENARIRWKIDLIVLPIFLVVQALQFMDKTALNYANLFGYQQALGLKGQEFNYLSAMIYAGYFFGQYPCSLLIARFPAQRVLGVTAFIWGLTVIILTQCKTYSNALGVRFVMGMFEASVTPGLTIMTGFWYTRNEIPLRQCIWYSALGWGGIAGDYISLGINTLSGDFTPARWQLLFYILGAATCFWALVVFFVLPDSPASAFFLTKRERVMAVKRVAQNQMGIKNKTFNKKQALSTFKDPKAILLFISVFAAAIPNGVVNSFSTVIIQDIGFNTAKTTEMKSVGDAIVIVSLFIGGAITLNVSNSRLATATLANILCTICAATMAYLPQHNKWGRLVSFWMVNTQSVGFTISLVTITSNMAGYSHKAAASVLIFTAYCWGNFAGPFVVKPSQAPEYRGATIGLLVGYLIKMITHLLLWAYLVYMNRSRDKRYGPSDKARSSEAGMQDKTEFENKDFRFVY